MTNKDQRDSAFVVQSISKRLEYGMTYGSFVMSFLGRGALTITWYLSSVSRQEYAALTRTLDGSTYIRNKDRCISRKQ